MSANYDPSVTDEIIKSMLTAASRPHLPARETVKSYQSPLTKLAPEVASGGFSRFGAFAKSVYGSQNGNFKASPEMTKWVEQISKALPTGMNESVGADGGYLVPPEFVNQVMMRTYDNDLMGRTQLFPMSGAILSIPAVNETSRADGSRFGGVVSAWRGEAGLITTSKPALNRIDLKPESLTVAVQVTQELLDDSATALETFLQLVVGQELQFKIGQAIVRGDGVGKPLGLLNSPSKVIVSKESGQVTGTILSQNVLNMWSRLHPSCVPNAVWLYDQSCIPALGAMTIGTAGANLAVYQPPGGLSQSPYATLMGKPLIPVEFCSPLSTEGDLILTDLSTYLTATRGDTQYASSMHVAFLSNEMVYRFILRMDGKPWWRNPLTPASGGPTQSNIVTLQTR